MKNKEQIAKIWDVLDSLNVDVLHNKQAIIKLENEREKPQLKQLDQSAFDHPYVTDRFNYVALNADGQTVFFEQKPTVSVNLDIWVVTTGSLMPMLKGYDASNWQDSLIEREPKLKQLDQSVFNGLDSKWLYAAIDDCTGRAYVYEHEPHTTHDRDYWGIYEGLQRVVGEGYDTTNWQTLLIKRETIELTGSELCKAMLERGDKFVVCFMSNGHCDTVATSNKEVGVATNYNLNTEIFNTLDGDWDNAIPINNQGEPLTSSDVGL